jgi:hypothetical protein
VSDELHEIMRALGRLEQGMERQRADFDAEKEASRDSRGRVHTKLEKIEGDVAIVGQVAAQARDKADELEKTMVEDVKPATDDFKRMRTIGFVGLSLLGFAFTALGITLATVGEGVVNSIRAWLRIN